jgi:hypothetical protein
MRRSIVAAILAVGFLGSASAAQELSAAADEELTEEELVAPLVMKQNCWGGIIRFILASERFEVDDTLCADGSFYHLEFDASLRMVEKRWVRNPMKASKSK